MENAPFRKQQSSIRFSILNDQSAVKTGGSSKMEFNKPQGKEIHPPKRGGFERKNNFDSKSLDTMINELYNTMIALNTNFKDLFKKQKLKTPSKTTFNEILTQLLMLYDDNDSPALNLSDEEIIQLFRDLGYPYLVRDDVLKIIGAPHNWHHGVSLLHWLSQIIETEGAGGEQFNLMAEGFNDDLEEESIFDMVRKGIENRVTAEELSRNFLSQQDTASDEHKVRTKLNAVQDEISKIKTEIVESKKDQPALAEIKKQLSETFLAIQRIKTQQNSVLKDITSTSNQSKDIISKLDAKKDSISQLQINREQVEDRIRDQPFDADTEKAYQREIKEQANLLAGIKASTAKKLECEADMKAGIDRESELIDDLKGKFDKLLGQVRFDDRLAVHIDMPREQYSEVKIDKKVVESFQNGFARELSQIRQKLQTVEGEEHLLKKQVDNINAHNKDLEAKLQELNVRSKKLKEQLEIQTKSKSGKEMAINSKKTTLMADIQGQNALLAQEERQIESLIKDIEKADKETDRMKQLIRDHVMNSRDLLCKFKENHVEKIRSEADRVTYIKDGLSNYLKGKKKLN